ncbi:MAG TPA: isocitrate dehydrogenase (NADP(+)) [bacterium]|nr:isocitrate dehydrogenase (NADP(+)) [bacterium]
MPEKITIRDGNLSVPDNPIICLLKGDGTGPEIVDTAVSVIDRAVAKAYDGRRKLHWLELPAGLNSLEAGGELLPAATLAAIRDHVIALKGPMTTPVGEGFRSVNVTLRQQLDLYACVRPVKHFDSVPSPICAPQKLDIVIFRENTEDVYTGIEYAADSKEAESLMHCLHDLGADVRIDSAVGIKPISRFGSKRLIRRAVEYALAHGRRRITFMHKGNIMKFTEGAFRNWGYEVAREMLGERMVTLDEVGDEREPPAGKILVQDKIADAMFQDLLLRPHWHEVIATTNLNGDYLSDAAAAQVGGLGMAPGANIGDDAAVFEATHGSAPHYAGQDKVNPSSVILSGVLMLEHLGWKEAGALIMQAIQETIQNETVTYDLARQITGATTVRCSEFGKLIEEAIARG